MNTDESTLELIRQLSSDAPQNNIKLSKNKIIEEIEGHLIVNNYDQEVIAMLYWGFIYFKAKLNSIRDNPPDHWRENVIACHKAKAYLQPKYRPIEQPDNNLFNIDLPLQETSPNKTITNKLNRYRRVYRHDVGLDVVKCADDMRLLYENDLQEYKNITPGATKQNFLTFKLLEVDKLLNAIEINNFSVSNAGWLVIYKQILEDESKKLNDRIKNGDDIVAAAVKGKPEEEKIQEPQTIPEESNKPGIMVGDLIANKNWNTCPLDFVVEHLKSLTTQHNVNAEPYLSHTDFISFVKKAFLGDKTISKIHLKAGAKDKTPVVDIFYTLFEACSNTYTIKNDQSPFKNLLTDNFDNWNQEEIKNSFRKNRRRI